MKNIPNLLTLVNLLAGCVAIIAVCTADYSLMFGCLAISAIADFLDGFAARALGVTSNIGKELDSLADMVSFGLVPGLIMYKLISFISSGTLTLRLDNLSVIGFLITLASAYRLAKFNVDERQSSEFRGLNTPMNTLFVYGLYAIIMDGSSSSFNFLHHEMVLIVITVICSFLLISDFRMFKLKLGPFQSHISQYILLGISIGLCIWLKEKAFSFIVILYILFSLFNLNFKK